jgi:hypothetical protein
MHRAARRNAGMSDKGKSLKAAIARLKDRHPELADQLREYRRTREEYERSRPGQESTGQAATVQPAKRRYFV